MRKCYIYIYKQDGASGGQGARLGSRRPDGGGAPLRRGAGRAAPRHGDVTVYIYIYIYIYIIDKSYVLCFTHM